MKEPAQKHSIKFVLRFSEEEVSQLETLLDDENKSNLPISVWMRNKILSRLEEEDEEPVRRKYV